jgi:site-specific DNA-cytosine methylase
LRHQIWDRAFQVVRNVAYRSPVMRLRLKPDGLKQRLGGDMTRMGDERDGHPRVDRLICPADLPRLPAGPVGENEGAGNRKQEGESKNQHAPPRFSHTSI